MFYQHLGIYAYRREVLLRFATLPPSSLEQAEKLEQLRMLQTGGTILVGVVEHASSGIDTPADYAAFVRAAAVNEAEGEAEGKQLAIARLPLRPPVLQCRA